MDEAFLLSLQPGDPLRLDGEWRRCFIPEQPHAWVKERPVFHGGDFSLKLEVNARFVQSPSYVARFEA